MSLVNSIEALGRPVAYYPSIAVALGGDPSAAIFVCQFIYWRSRVGDKEVHKSRSEITAETGLGDEAQKRICRKLKNIGVLQVTKKGLPAKNFYRFDWGKLSDLLGGITPTSQGETPSLDMVKHHDRTGYNTTTTSEITTEITTEITNIADKPQNALSKKTEKPAPKPKPKNSNLTANTLITDYKVSEQVAADYMAVRKAKRSPLTKTAFDKLAAQFKEANLTIPDGIRICAERGWVGFNASWNWQQTTENVPIEQLDAPRQREISDPFGDERCLN